jgi:hypothetical protein
MTVEDSICDFIAKLDKMDFSDDVERRNDLNITSFD